MHVQSMFRRVVVLLIKSTVFETFPTRSRSFVRSLLGSKAQAQGMRRKLGERNKNQWRIQGRGLGARPLLIFRPNWGPKGRKKLFWTPPPLPPLISRSGTGTAVMRSVGASAFWIYHWIPNSKLWFIVSLTGPCRTPWKGWKTADWRKG